MEKIKKTSLYLPADLMKRLKIYCIQEEKTMTAVLQEAIEAFVVRKEKTCRETPGGHAVLTSIYHYAMTFLRLGQTGQSSIFELDR